MNLDFYEKKYNIKYLLQDAILISFPKCGRTWLRMILAKILKNLGYNNKTYEMIYSIHKRPRKLKLLLGRSYIMRALATKSVSKGYIQVNAEGRTITKAYQELVLEAENTLQEYKEFIMNTTRREATSTQFLDDTSVIDSWTRQDIINIMNGVSDGEDFQRTYDLSFYWSRR